jgi:hypothetical protein
VRRRADLSRGWGWNSTRRPMDALGLDLDLHHPLTQETLTGSNNLAYAPLPTGPQWSQVRIGAVGVVGARQSTTAANGRSGIGELDLR